MPRILAPGASRLPRAYSGNAVPTPGRSMLSAHSAPFVPSAPSAPAPLAPAISAAPPTAAAPPLTTLTSFAASAAPIRQTNPDTPVASIQAIHPIRASDAFQTFRTFQTFHTVHSTQPTTEATSAAATPFATAPTASPSASPSAPSFAPSAPSAAPPSTAAQPPRGARPLRRSFFAPASAPPPSPPPPASPPVAPVASLGAAVREAEDAPEGASEGAPEDPEDPEDPEGASEGGASERAPAYASRSPSPPRSVQCRDTAQALLAAAEELAEAATIPESIYLTLCNAAKMLHEGGAVPMEAYERLRRQNFRMRERAVHDRLDYLDSRRELLRVHRALSHTIQEQHHEYNRLLSRFNAERRRAERAVRELRRSAERDAPRPAGLAAGLAAATAPRMVDGASQTDDRCPEKHEGGRRGRGKRSRAATSVA